MAQVQTLVETGAPIALTVDLDAADDGVVAMVRRVATTVRLPGLAQCREHLPSLVQEVLAERPGPESATRFASSVWDRLMSWPWPGNVAELHHTVVLLARRAEGGIVEIDDLPDELRTPRRALGMLESAEREAVADALRAAGGNRARAARALGIRSQHPLPQDARVRDHLIAVGPVRSGARRRSGDVGAQRALSRRRKLLYREHSGRSWALDERDVVR